MKTMMIVFMAFGLCAHAQTDFYTNVTNLWYQGYKTNVLQIAEQRLQSNTNDIAGLLLKMEYELEFVELASLSNSMHRVLMVGATVNTPKFQGLYDELSLQISVWLDAIKAYPPDEILADKAKALVGEKPLSGSIFFEALQKDGFFD
jgi:hypothetical protein